MREDWVVGDRFDHFGQIWEIIKIRGRGSNKLYVASRTLKPDPFGHAATEQREWTCYAMRVVVRLYRIGEEVSYMGLSPLGRYKIEKDYGNGVYLIGNGDHFCDMVPAAHLSKYGGSP